MRRVKIISDGTVEGTKILDDAGNMIGMVKRAEIVIDAHQKTTHARLEFLAPELLISGVEVDEEKSGAYPRSPVVRATYTEIHPPSEIRLTNGSVAKPVAALVHTSDLEIQQIAVIEDDGCFLQCIRQPDGSFKVSPWILPEVAQTMDRLAQRVRVRR